MYFQLWCKFEGQEWHFWDSYERASDVVRHARSFHDHYGIQVQIKEVAYVQYPASKTLGL